MILRLARKLVEDRPRDDVARCQLPARIDGEAEALARIVDEDAAFSAGRLGDQKRRRSLNGKRRGVELHELDVCERRTGVERQQQTVSGRAGRIRCARVGLTDAAGRKSRRTGELRQHFLVRQQPRAATTAFAHDQAHRARSFDDAHVGMVQRLLRERGRDSSAGGVARKNRASVAVSGFPRQRQRAPNGDVEGDAHAAQFFDALRRFGGDERGCRLIA